MGAQVIDVARQIRERAEYIRRWDDILGRIPDALTQSQGLIEFLKTSVKEAGGNELLQEGFRRVLQETELSRDIVKRAGEVYPDFYAGRAVGPEDLQDALRLDDRILFIETAYSQFSAMMKG